MPWSPSTTERRTDPASASFPTTRVQLVPPSDEVQTAEPVGEASDPVVPTATSPSDVEASAVTRPSAASSTTAGCQVMPPSDHQNRAAAVSVMGPAHPPAMKPS